MTRPSWRELAAALESASDRLTVETIDDEAAALEFARTGRVGCLVVRPAATDPGSLLEQVREDSPNPPVFVITDDRDEATASAAPRPVRPAVCPIGGSPRGTARDAYRACSRAGERAAQPRSVDRRFRALTENATFAVVTASDDGRIQYANDAVESIVGYAPEELVGERISTIVPARYQNSHRDTIARYLRTGEQNLDWDWVEFDALHADGHEVPVGISFGEAFVDGEHLFTAVIRDLRDRRRLEREREATLERIGDAFVSIDADWEYTYVNEQAVDLLQRPDEELLGEPLETAFETVDGTELERQLERAFTEQTIVSFTEYFTSLGRWFDIRAHPSEDGLSIFFTDVTDRIRAEQELEANVTALQTLYDISTKPDTSLDKKLPELLELGCEYLGLPHGFLTQIDLDEDPDYRQVPGRSRALAGGRVLPAFGGVLPEDDQDPRTRHCRDRRRGLDRRPGLRTVRTR